MLWNDDYGKVSGLHRFPTREIRQAYIIWPTCIYPIQFNSLRPQLLSKGQNDTPAVKNKLTLVESRPVEMFGDQCGSRWYSPVSCFCNLSRVYKYFTQQQYIDWHDNTKSSFTVVQYATTSKTVNDKMSKGGDDSLLPFVLSTHSMIITTPSSV